MHVDVDVRTTVWVPYCDKVWQNGSTPLHSAAGNGQLETCKLLLEMKADVNAKDQVRQLQHPWINQLIYEGVNDSGR